jgi:hypothetical protein
MAPASVNTSKKERGSLLFCSLSGTHYQPPSCSLVTPEKTQQKTLLHTKAIPTLKIGNRLLNLYQNGNRLIADNLMPLSQF